MFELLVGVFIVVTLAAFYFLPTLMCQHSCGLMFIANLFFGWTLIGWLILFAVAFTTRGPIPKDIA